MTTHADTSAGVRLRIRGLVQGVGLRPTVWRLAQELGLAGDVRNDAEGVLIRAWGTASRIDVLIDRLRTQAPPLARIDAIERSMLIGAAPRADFRIVASDTGGVRTGIVPDAATCPACRREIFDPADRRYRYAFTNCTHCGPRLSIVRGIPYDRAHTSMAAFDMCAACRAEYEDPADRRFHAQPNACPRCGPMLWLEDNNGNVLNTTDAISAASALLTQGKIVALKGIGGFHLACDATNDAAVATLRQRKRREAKPFALMARDMDVIHRYCVVDSGEQDLLESIAAPIVLLDVADLGDLAPAVAPGQYALGFMLPHSPLHHLLLAQWDRPLVMTSGNMNDAPPCIANKDARERLASIANFILLHDREIVTRVDDAVARVVEGAPRVLRRARGYAPAPLHLPPGLAAAPPLLALGGEMKNTACLVRDGEAILTQHMGDLEEARTEQEYRRIIELYSTLFQHTPTLLAVDIHPEYRASKLGRAWFARDGVSLIEVQHHHAHIAACLVEHGWPVDGGAVLGIALDGLGYGADGTLWGGEILAAGYASYRRLAHLAYTPLPGGAQALREPWRNAYAQLATHVGWEQCLTRYGDLPFMSYLRSKPLPALESMLRQGVNTPPTSSCGRLFDAVAAVLGVCAERVSYEGQTAMELEALARRGNMARAVPYPFTVDMNADLLVLNPASMWEALLADLQQGTLPCDISTRFHAGLARALVDIAALLAPHVPTDTVALSGGVFQNVTLLMAVCAGLRAQGLRPLTHSKVPCNDGGLSLGQAVVACAATADGSSPTIRLA